jgi:hypothetical protein
MIDWASFTPWTALAGGALIGAAAAMLVLVNGRIAGISGIVGGLLRPGPGDTAWRIAFVGGLMVAAVASVRVVEIPNPRDVDDRLDSRRRKGAIATPGVPIQSTLRHEFARGQRASSTFAIA